jgi:hypothetical protein
MASRKTVNMSSTLVIVRKKKTQQPSFGTTTNKNGKVAVSTTSTSRAFPTSTVKPSPRPASSPRSIQSTIPPVQAPPVAPQQETTPTRPNKYQRKAQAPYQLLEVLRTRWPLAFPGNPRKIRPFMRGIHREIAKLLPGTGLWLIKRAIVLFQKLNGEMYWQAVLKGGPRYALDGSPRGEVTPREQEHARQALAALAEAPRGQTATASKGKRASSSSSEAPSSV